ncbi:MAG TPA: hypothetical protein VNC17_10145 [Thermoleophilaceae bacterium]|jgi:hypothetical protein|nr:hypothetical protein [Thermoleophilaceae bacterium]
MGCLLAIFAGFFPRIALVCLWIFTNDVDRAYDSFIVPLLGLIFLPLTTLVYALLWSPAGGVEGIEWLWVGIALVLDLSAYGGGARARRDS